MTRLLALAALEPRLLRADQRDRPGALEQRAGPSACRVGGYAFTGPAEHCHDARGP